MNTTSDESSPRASESRSEGWLESWKEIAAYLRRSVRSARRWEKEEGLPIHRHLHGKGDSVYAYKEELDAWWKGRGARVSDSENTETDETTASASANSKPVAPTLPPTQEISNIPLHASVTPVPAVTEPTTSTTLEARPPTVSHGRLRSWLLFTGAAFLVAVVAAFFLMRTSPSTLTARPPTSARIAANPGRASTNSAVPSGTAPSETGVAERAPAPAATTARETTAAAGELFITSPCEAVIAKIRALDNNDVLPLPSDKTTPIVLTLPRGRYSIQFQSLTCGGTKAIETTVASRPAEIRLPFFPPGLSVDDLMARPPR